MTPAPRHLELGETKWTVESSGGTTWQLSSGTRTIEIAVDSRETTPGTISLLHEGRSLTAFLVREAEAAYLHIGGQRIEVRIYDPRSLNARRDGASGASGVVTLKSPMPGRIVRVLVQKGDRVEAKQGVLVVEAMKMQNELKAPKAGTVETVEVAAGDAVAGGQRLVTVR